jgi:hypothetical protein
MTTSFVSRSVKNVQNGFIKYYDAIFKNIASNKQGCTLHLSIKKSFKKEK